MKNVFVEPFCQSKVDLQLPEGSRKLELGIGTEFFLRSGEAQGFNSLAEELDIGVIHEGFESFD